MAESRSIAITAAVIGAAGAIAAALITVVADDDGNGGQGQTIPTIQPGTASVFLSKDSGPGGEEIRVSGEGFAGGERVVISFHTEEIGSTNANDGGSFANVTVEIPTSFSPFAPQQFFVMARGEQSLRVARAPFTISG